VETDFFQVETLLSEQEIDFRNRVRRFVEEKCMPVIVEHFDKGTFPLDLVPQMAEMGLFGVHIQGYGCRKTSHTAYGLACQELGRCDSGLRAMFSVQNSLVMHPIHAFGSEEQRSTWLPKLQSGSSRRLFRPLGTGFRINPGGMSTRAALHGDRYRLNGRRCGLPTGQSPRWRSSGPGPRTGSGVSWWRRPHRGSGQPPSGTSLPTAHPRLLSSNSRTARWRPRLYCREPPG
jgi:glutaryl-CoA dehydrogenase